MFEGELNSRSDDVTRGRRADQLFCDPINMHAKKELNDRLTKMDTLILFMRTGLYDNNRQYHNRKAVVLTRIRKKDEGLINKVGIELQVDGSS